MRISAVIITRNEAPRLRLVLESFANQDLLSTRLGIRFALEVVLVDDGSTDETPEVIRSYRERLPLTSLRHPESLGRSPARNAGVRAASGEVIVLFDGDCLAAPNLIRRHGEVHATRPGVMGRGETYHLRSTRFFHDPELGTPMPGAEERVQRMGDELPGALVTRQQIRDDFPSLAARGEPGIYAGAGPRRLYELEMQALHEIPDASVLWMTAPGQNFSMRRADFLAVNGFDARFTLNEHRELAFRLYERGLKMVPVDDARSFHMLHRVGWRDPAQDTDWERLFYEAHPCLAAKLMNVFWLSLARDGGIPPEARITSLEQFEAIINDNSFDYDSLRSGHPKLAALGS
jgi:glycosyltransferase involved in cell wall biosynthesis